MTGNRLQVWIATLGIATVALTGPGCAWYTWLDPSKTIASESEPKLIPIFSQIDPMEDYRETIPNAEPPRLEDLHWSDADYVMGPGDVVNIGVLDLYTEGVEAMLQRTVGNAGFIKIPMIDERIRLVGLTGDQAREAIVAAYQGSFLQNPAVSLEVVAQRQSRYTVYGAIARPGAYGIPRREFRLNEALAQAGDVIQYNIRYIYVIRRKGEGPTTQPVAGVAPTATVVEPLPTLPGVAEPGSPAESEAEHLDELMKYLPDAEPNGEVETAPPAETAPEPVVPDVDLDELRKMMPSGSPSPATRPIKPSILHLSETTSLAGGRAAPRGDAAAFEWVYENERWIRVPVAPAAVEPPRVVEPVAVPKAPPADTAPPSPATVAARVPTPSASPSETGLDPEDPFGWAQADMSGLVRVIAVDLEKLKQANPRQNIIVRDGDEILIPTVTVGEFYVMGEVLRPGAYNLSGKNLTVKQALSAAGGFSQLAWPSNAMLIRRIGQDQELRIPLRLDRIMAGKEPEVFLRPNDVIAVGTHAAARFLAIIRNSFRMTYGFGFIYDRNFADVNFGQSQSVGAAVHDFWDELH